MATDLKLTSDRDLKIDPTGDLATVEGERNVEQQHANAIYRALALTEETFPQSVYLANLDSNIRDELFDIDSVTRIVNLGIDREDNARVTISVRTNLASTEVTE